MWCYRMYSRVAYFIFSVLAQHADICKAINICPKGYRCDKNKKLCVHLCEDITCRNDGVCDVTVDTSGTAIVECRFVLCFLLTLF